MNRLLQRVVVVVLSICISVLALNLAPVLFLSSRDLLLRKAGEDQPTINRRVLQVTERMETDIVPQKREVPGSYESSKRKVRGGSDPIHNKSNGRAL